MPTNLDKVLHEMRRRIYGGARLLRDDLSNDELTALRMILLEGEAEIINKACKPYVVRKLAP
jgi:hypothetical protein